MAAKPPRFPRSQPDAPALLASTALLAFDPGEATGIVVVHQGALVESRTVPFEQMIRFAADEDDLLLGTFGAIDHIVCERWSLYDHKSEVLVHSELKPVQVVGMIRVIATRLVVPITFQPAAMAKEFVPDSRLFLYGWRLRSYHEKDAARHAITYLAHH